MCLIIRKPVGRTIPAEFLAEAWIKNHDGYGWCYAENGVVRWGRGLDYQSALLDVAQIPADREAFIHVRRATAGSITTELAHPFEVLPNLVLLHNGKLDIEVSAPNMSDTWQLVQQLHGALSRHPARAVERIIRSVEFSATLNDLVKGSVVVLFDRLGPVFYGKPWHVVTLAEWPELQGIEVSNTTTWSPRACAR